MVESPSAAKLREGIREWLAGYSTDINGYAPATIDERSCAHSAPLVDGILNMQVPDGMESDDPRFVESL